MDKSEFLRSFEEAEEKGEYNFPVEIQRFCLGLSDNKVRELYGKMVLDPCCGREGKLVTYLREKGVSAEGMDPLLELENEFLTRRGVARSVGGRGSIPKKDGTYDLILMNGLREVYFPFSGVSYFEKKKDHLGSVLILSELLRVLRYGGEMICYPSAPNLLAEHLGFNSQIRVIHEDLETETTKIPDINLLFKPFYGAESEKVLELWQKRTKIIKG
jgi:hypothetical protein